MSRKDNNAVPDPTAARPMNATNALRATATIAKEDEDFVFDFDKPDPRARGLFAEQSPSFTPVPVPPGAAPPLALLGPPANAVGIPAPQSEPSAPMVAVETSGTLIGLGSPMPGVETLPEAEDLDDVDTAEAGELDIEIRRGLTLTPLRLYLLATSKNGLRHIGFSKLADYVADRMNVDYRTVEYWLDQVENTLIVRNWDRRKIRTLFENDLSERQILVPQTITRELNKIKKPEMKRKVYDTMRALKTEGTFTNKGYIHEWKRLVAQVLKTGMAESNQYRAPSLPAAENDPLPDLVAVSGPSEPDRVMMALWEEEAKERALAEEIGESTPGMGEPSPMRVPLVPLGVPSLARPLATFRACKTKYSVEGDQLEVYFENRPGVVICVTFPVHAMELEEWVSDGNDYPTNLEGLEGVEDDEPAETV